MPLIGSGHDTLIENTFRAVFSAFEFVANDGEFGEEIFAGDEAVDEAVRFELDGEFEVLIVCGKSFEVVGAVLIGGAIEAVP